MCGYFSNFFFFGTNATSHENDLNADLPAMTNYTFVTTVFIFPFRTRYSRIRATVTYARILGSHWALTNTLLRYRGGYRGRGRYRRRTRDHRRWTHMLLHVLLWRRRNLQRKISNIKYPEPSLDGGARRNN